MARAYLRYSLKDTDGNAIQNALVNLYQDGTTTPVTNAWNAAVGGSLITSAVTNAQGEIEAWFDVPQTIRVVATDNNDLAHKAGSTTARLSFLDVPEQVPVNPQAENIVNTITDQEVAGVKTGLDDWFFKKGRPFLSAAAFHSEGVDASGGNDSGVGLGVASQEACAANLPLFFDRGTYVAEAFTSTTATMGDGVTQRTADIALPLTRGIRIFAEPGTATIVVAAAGDRLLGWESVIGVPAHADIDLSGLDIDGLTFDAQSSLNPSTSTNAGTTRYMINAYNGRSIRVRNCRFKNQTGRNVVSILGFFAGNVVEDAEVAFNLFDNIGTVYWHDHATTYIDSNRARHHHNTYIGAIHADGTWNNAWSPYEIHGQSAISHDNVVYNFAGSGLLVSSRVGDIGGKPQTLKAFNNVGYNVGSGIGLNMQQSATDYDVYSNDIVIAIDQWSTVAAAGGDPNGPYPGLAWRSGFALQAGALTTTRWGIHHNKVRWLPWTTALTGGENFVRWDRPNRAPVDDTDLKVNDNEVTNCPSAPIRIEQLRAVNGMEVRRNWVRNLGVGALGDNKQVFVSIGKQVWQTTTRPTGLVDVQVTDNTIIDDQATGTSKYLVMSDDPVSKTVSATTTNGTNVITMVGNAHDLGSLVVHPNVPANTTLIGVSTFASGSAFDITAFTMSANATASGTADATVTSQPPTTNGVNVMDNHWRRADSKTVPIARLQSGQSAYIRERVRTFALPEGAGTAEVGSTILEKLTGIERTQITAPTGSNWALPDALNPLKLSTPPVAWYDAAMMTLADAATATQFTDFSGNGNHALVLGGAPKFHRSVINGYPVMRFATTDFFTDTFTLAQPFTRFLVAKHNSSAGTQTWLDGATVNTALLQKNSSHNLEIFAGSFVIAGPPGVSWFISAATFDGASSVLRLGGGAGVTGNAGAGSPGGITIGGRADSTFGVDGDIAEILVIPGAVSLANINTVGRYLALKFNLSWTMAV